MWINEEILEEGDFGFVYKITNLTNAKIYIGKKQLIFTRRKRLGKKEKALTPRKTYKTVTKESDWRTYYGSNKVLLEDIRAGHDIKREILCSCKTKALLTYFETKYQFVESVIERDTYNDSVLGKFYRKIFDV